jgi:hypothetical protein
MADLRPRSLVGSGLGAEYTVVEFASADAALGGAKALVARGLSQVEAFTPYAVPELDAALGVRRSRIPFGAFAMGATGCTLAFLLIWWTAAVAYPLDVGGRPYNSIVADIPILFETTVLFTGVSAFLAVLLRSKLPRLYHPVFTIDGFERTTLDRYWLGIDHSDAKLDDEALASLVGLGAVVVHRSSGVAPEAPR